LCESIPEVLYNGQSGSQTLQKIQKDIAVHASQKAMISAQEIPLADAFNS
jgi:hypothetical protein